MKAFLSPISFRQDSGFHDLLWAPKGTTVANQGRSSQGTTWGKIKEDQRGSSSLGDHLRHCTHSNLVSNPTLQKLCRRKKNTKLLLPWSLCHVPAWLHNHCLLAREEGTVLEALIYYVPPLPGKGIKALFSFPSSPSLCLHISLALVHREPRSWQHSLWTFFSCSLIIMT